MSRFSVTVKGRWGEHGAAVEMSHHSERADKQHAEMAVLLANLIRYARTNYGFTPEEITSWEAMR